MAKRKVDPTTSLSDPAEASPSDNQFWKNFQEELARRRRDGDKPRPIGLPPWAKRELEALQARIIASHGKPERHLTEKELVRFDLLRECERQEYAEYNRRREEALEARELAEQERKAEQERQAQEREQERERQIEVLKVEITELKARESRHSEISRKGGQTRAKLAQEKGALVKALVLQLASTIKNPALKPESVALEVQRRWQVDGVKCPGRTFILECLASGPDSETPPQK
jgi:hypothetical protein